MSKKAEKFRLDALLVRHGLAENPSRARAIVLSGRVFSGERRLEKPGMQLDVETPIELRGPQHPWASRGGVKLAFALQHFGIDPTDKTALDIGASHGGFTDVLCQGAARRIYAVDVGYGQLDWKLRNNPRVCVLERINARHLTNEEVPEAVDLIVCDASFIGLEKILPKPLSLAAPGAVLIALIKPQFEVGKGKVGKRGVVREPAQHAEVCERITAWLQTLPGWTVLGLTDSPILGSEGNKEFLIAARFEG